MEALTDVFEDFQTSLSHKLGHKSFEKLLSVIAFYSIPINMLHDGPLLRIPFKSLMLFATPC